MELLVNLSKLLYSSKRYKVLLFLFSDVMNSPEKLFSWLADFNKATLKFKGSKHRQNFHTIQDTIEMLFKEILWLK